MQFTKMDSKSAKKLVERDDDDESENDDDETECDNDDVDKEKVLEPCNPYIEYYVKQALANPSHNFKAL